MSIERAVAQGEHPFVLELRHRLALLPETRYDIGLSRVSTRDLNRLDDNEDTGIGVYANKPDFQALSELSSDVRQRGWIAVSYRDLHPGASASVFGWVGLVGTTVFVAVADSAIEANLPADPGDVARLGRNAFMDLLVAAALAARAKNVYIPFRSRWWRRDLWANYLMETINLRLPGCVMWEGDQRVATKGQLKLLTDIGGRQAATYADTFAEQVFEKGVTHLRQGGQWPRPDSELPFGLRRKRVALGDGIVDLSLTVEEHPEMRAVAQRGLEMVASGTSWGAIGRYFAAQHVPMPGNNGRRRRKFSDYAVDLDRGQAAKRLLVRGLPYYEHGEYTVRRSTRLPVEELRGIHLDYDPDTGRRYIDVPVKGLPHRPFLSDAQWVQVHDRLARAKKRQRTGGAAHDRSADSRASAFQGVATWLEIDGRDGTLRPDSFTCYRWRIRPHQTRGWAPTEGEIEASLPRGEFDFGFAQALIAAIEAVGEPLQPLVIVEDAVPEPAFEDTVKSLRRAIAAAAVRSKRATAELLSATEDADATEIDHWRHEGKKARQEKGRLMAQLAAARSAVADDAAVEHEETVQADVTGPLLVASLMRDGEGWVDPLVARGLEEMGVTDTLKCCRDPADPSRVIATATATLKTLDGRSVVVPLTWRCRDTHGKPVRRCLTVRALLQAWAPGCSLEEVADGFPGFTATSVRRRIRAHLKQCDDPVRESRLRAALLESPIQVVRAIIAARLLGDPTLAAGVAVSLVEQVESAYFEGGHRDGAWCNPTYLDDARRILTVFAESPDTWQSGLQVPVLARLSSVSRARIREITRRLGLLEKVGSGSVRPHRCRHVDCATKPALTVYAPFPEAGSGLVCPACWRADGLDAVLGEAYLVLWKRETGGRYEVAPTPKVGRASDNDTLLIVSEAAARMGLTQSFLRILHKEGALVPTERSKTGDRLYSRKLIDSISEDVLDGWRWRCGPVEPDGLLSVCKAAALKGVPASTLGRIALARPDLLPAANDGKRVRRYRRADVDALDVSAFALTSLDTAARHFGLQRVALTGLARTGKVSCMWTPQRRRRFDLATLAKELDAIGIRGSGDNPIVSISELARHPLVQLPIGVVRRLSDKGVIPVAGQLGASRRRYRLNDAVAAVELMRRSRTSSELSKSADDL